jgi:hypothetical protein
LKNRKGGEKGKNMKNNKFCVSRTLVYLVLLVVAVVGAFYVMNYANSQKVGSEPKAAGVKCLSDGYSFNCKINNNQTSVNYWVGFIGNQKKYYKDNTCTKEITEGLGNYCQGLSGNKTSCVRAYCNDPNTNKPLYTKDGKYYLNSSCLGVIGIDNSGTFQPVTSTNIEDKYCTKKISELIPLQYDCPSPMQDVQFYYKNGQYYKNINDAKNNIKVVTDFGVGNFCKIISPSGGASDRLKNTLITSSCKELGIDTNNKPDKPISFYARDLSKNVNQFSTYFLGTSQASAYTTDYQKAVSYCNAANGSNYVYSNCLPRLCSNSDKIYWMKNGVIYNLGSCVERDKTTYALACQSKLTPTKDQP